MRTTDNTRDPEPSSSFRRMSAVLGESLSRMSIRPVRVAIVNDYDVVVAGVASLLERHPDRVRLVELVAGQVSRSDVDVVLYDTFARQDREGSLRDVVRRTHGRVAVYSWHDSAEQVEAVMRAGAAGFLSKTLGVEALVEGLEKIHRGLVMRAAPAVGAGEEGAATAPPRGWPGRDLGLSEREAEVMALVTRGLSNQEMASSLYLSVNSIKTYVRTAYQKAGVHTRAQAVLWGVRHGFDPDVTRVTEDD